VWLKRYPHHDLKEHSHTPTRHAKKRRNFGYSPSAEVKHQDDFATPSLIQNAYEPLTSLTGVARPAETTVSLSGKSTSQPVILPAASNQFWNSHVDPRPVKKADEMVTQKWDLVEMGKRDGGQKTLRQWERKEERDAEKGKFDKREAGMWQNTWTMRMGDRKYH